MTRLGLSLAAALLASTAAHATVLFSTTNTHSPTEQVIQFESPITGTTITGDTNRSQTPVIFDTTFAKNPSSIGGAGTGQEMLGQGVGQSHITCVPGATACVNNHGNQSSQLNSMEMRASPGTAWTDVIANPDFGVGNMNVFVKDQLGNNFDFTLTHGSNFFTLIATGGEVITLVDMTMSPGGGWNDFQQPRVSGVCQMPTGSTTCTPIPIPMPEPIGIALLGVGLCGIGLVRIGYWRRRGW